MKIVLATLSRHTYSGWSLFIEGRAASSQISEVILDQSVSHLALTRAAAEKLVVFAQIAEEHVELYVVDDRQRSGLRHPSVGPLKNITVMNEPPTDAMTRRARKAIEDKYHAEVKRSPWDGDPSTVFFIATAAEMNAKSHGASVFGMEAAGTGVVLAAAGDIHTERGIVRVTRHDAVVAELGAIHAALGLAMKTLPTLRSTVEHAVISTTSQEALDAIAYPWGGSKARRLAAGKVIEQLNRIKCGEKLDRYAAIFRLAENTMTPYQSAAMELAKISISDHSSLVERGHFRRSHSHTGDAQEEAVRNRLAIALQSPHHDIAIEPEAIPASPEIAVSEVKDMPLFHFPEPSRNKETQL